MTSLLLATWLAATGAAATQPPECAAPASSRPPSVRCDETLDGRAPPRDPPAYVASRMVLAAPRLVTRAAMYPVVRTSEFVEEHDVLPRVRAFLTSEDGLRGVRPELRYSSGFLPTAGLRLFDHATLGPGSRAEARFETAGPSVLTGGLLFGWRDPVPLSLRVTYERRDDYLFAGINGPTDAELRAAGRTGARYAAAGWRGTVRVDPAPRGPWTFFAETGLLDRVYDDSDAVEGPPLVTVWRRRDDPACEGQSDRSCVDADEVPGFARGLRVIESRAGFHLDSRGGVRAASGVGLGLEGGTVFGFAGDPSRVLRARGEVIGAVGGMDRALVLRLVGAVAENMGSTPMNFELLPTAAGADGVRGLRAGRLRGRSSVVGTAEYRWLLAPTLDAALFADLGGVAGRGFQGLDADRLYPSFGGGLRLFDAVSAYWRSPMRASFQVAYAPADDTVRFILQTSGF